MKVIVALFGIAAGAVLAIGQTTAAQWHAIGLALLALALRYGLTVLPWLLAALLAMLWRKERGLVALWREGYLEQSTYYAARMADVQAATEAATRRPAQRKTARR